MGIKTLEDSKILRDSFKRFGRPGISERIQRLAVEFAKEPTYFKAIHLAGRLRALALAARADSYWDEKQGIGFNDEVWWLKHHRAIVEKDSSGEVQAVIFEEQPTEDAK